MVPFSVNRSFSVASGITCSKLGWNPLIDEDTDRPKHCSPIGKACPNGYECQINNRRTQYLCCAPDLSASTVTLSSLPPPSTTTTEKTVTTKKINSKGTLFILKAEKKSYHSVCPTGRTPYLLNGAPQKCTISRCPAGYECTYRNNGYHCCSIANKAGLTVAGTAGAIVSKCESSWFFPDLILIFSSNTIARPWEVPTWKPVDLPINQFPSAMSTGKERMSSWFWMCAELHFEQSHLLPIETCGPSGIQFRNFRTRHLLQQRTTRSYQPMWRILGSGDKGCERKDREKMRWVDSIIRVLSTLFFPERSCPFPQIPIGGVCYELKNKTT